MVLVLELWNPAAIVIVDILDGIAADGGF